MDTIMITTTTVSTEDADFDAYIDALAELHDYVTFDDPAWEGGGR